MSKLKTAVLLLKNNKWYFISQLVKNFSFLFSDKQYLKCLFRCRMGYKLDLNNPKSYSEKLQWLKLYDRDPMYTSLVDKYEVKKYVSELIGQEHVAKTFGIWEKPEEINFDELPNRFVLKTTHGGGNEGVIVIKDKTKVNKSDIYARLSLALKQDLYKDSREWPYKNIKRRIIAEEYLEDCETGELRDYKFFCFNGKVKSLFVATERQSREEPFFNFFDSNFNELEIQQGHPRSSKVIEKPSMFDLMVEISEKLSKDLPHVRVDLYQANNKIYFGEFTFYHFGGMVPFYPNEWDLTFGSWMRLPNKK